MFFLEGGSILHIFLTYSSKHFMQIHSYTAYNHALPNLDYLLTNDSSGS